MEVAMEVEAAMQVENCRICEKALGAARNRPKCSLRNTIFESYGIDFDEDRADAPTRICQKCFMQVKCTLYLAYASSQLCEYNFFKGPTRNVCGNIEELQRD